MNKNGFFYQVLQGRNDVHLYIFGVLIVAFSYFVGQFPLLGAISLKAIQNPDDSLLERYQETNDLSVFGLEKNLAFILLLMMFVAAMAGLLIAIKYLHKKKLKDLITPARRYNWRKILFSFAFWFGISAIAEAVNYAMSPGDYTWQYEGSRFWILLIIALVLIPIQTSFEELFLRGYLMQGLGLAIKNKWVPVLLTSFAFGSLHLLNPEVSTYGWGVMLAYYVSAGLVMGLMTIFDDSLELALGAHAAVNLYAALILTYEGSAIDTYALFRVGEIDPASGLVGFSVIALVFFALCTWLYKWRPWSSLFEVLDFSEVPKDFTENNATDTEQLI